MGIPLPLEFKKEAKTVLIDFGENTTAHGIPRVTKARTFRGHMFWACVCLICIMVFLSQAIFLVQRFFRYETSTQIELKFETVEFPAVTVCNINPYKYSLVKNESSLEKMFTSLDRALSSGSGRDPREILKSMKDTAQRKPRQAQSTIDNETTDSGYSYRPVYADCNCPQDGAECVAFYNPPPDGKNATCVCRYESKQSTAWLCYPRSYWNGNNWCLCSTNGLCSRIHESKLYSDDNFPKNTEPCTCLHGTGPCIRTRDNHYDNLWDIPVPTSTETSTLPTTTTEEITTMSVEEVQREEAYGYENMTDPAAVGIQARINLIYELATMPTWKKIALSHKKEEFVKMCVFNRGQCEIERDFQLHVDPMYGNCYTFNFDARFNKTNRAGPVFGLRLILYLEVDEYLPLIQELGARIAVHTADSFPFPDVFGFNAPAGVTSSFGIRLKKVKRLPAPYGNCSFDAKAADYIYVNSTYSAEGCYRTCRQRTLLSACGCGEPRFPVPTGYRHCAPTNPVERKCIENATEALGSVYGNMPECHCPQPCDQAVYDATYSAAVWPSTNTHPSMLNCSGTTEECTKHLRENGAAIEIFFEQLNCEYLKESEAYPFVNLLADLGGQLGLWMGFSLITVVELLVLLWDLLYICCCRRKKPPAELGPSDDQYANYNGDIFGPVSVECTLQLRSNSVY